MKPCSVFPAPAVLSDFSPPCGRRRGLGGPAPGLLDEVNVLLCVLGRRNRQLLVGILPGPGRQRCWLGSIPPPGSFSPHQDLTHTWHALPAPVPGRDTKNPAKLDPEPGQWGDEAEGAPGGSLVEHEGGERDCREYKEMRARKGGNRCAKLRVGASST